MVTTTPRSRQATKVTQHFSSPGYVVKRPEHKLDAPVDATTYSVGYLTHDATMLSSS